MTSQTGVNLFYLPCSRSLVYPMLFCMSALIVNLPLKQVT